MKKFIIYTIAVASVVGVATAASFNLVNAPSAMAASSDYLLQIDGIKGSTGSTGGTIEVNSWSWGVSNNTGGGSSGGAGSGKVSISSFNFMKKVDKSSPLLYRASVSGNTLKTATFKIHLTGSEYAVLTFSDVTVSSYSLSGNTGRPTESVSFSYGKIEVSWPKSVQ